MPRSLALTAALFIGCTGPDPVHDTDTGPDEVPIEAGTEEVSTSWDVDLFDPLFESPTIARFDTLEGRRQLDGMTIVVEHTATMTVNVENGSAFALTADDYSHEFYLQSIIQLGRVDSDGEGEQDPPFFGPGSFLAVQAVDLAAADGTDASGDDFLEETITEDIQFEADYDWAETPTYLEAMIGTEELGLVVGGFSESWVFWSDEFGKGEAMLYAGASAVQYAGTMTVTYAYSPAE